MLDNNLPSTYVHNFKLYPRELILMAATHGRSLYKLNLGKEVESEL
ncbi:MAG: hypothetical protein ACLFM7_11150 [Bacteroidales bacterium]